MGDLGNGGEPLARMVPIRRRRAVPKGEVFAVFATAPLFDANELRLDLDRVVDQDLNDPYDGTGLWRCTRLRSSTPTSLPRSGSTTLRNCLT
jgi:hypothetical protein